MTVKICKYRTKYPVLSSFLSRNAEFEQNKAHLTERQACDARGTALRFSTACHSVRKCASPGSFLQETPPGKDGDEVAQYLTYTLSTFWRPAHGVRQRDLALGVQVQGGFARDGVPR